MTTLGRYELRDRLGRGGFASVYRAWDPRLQREVAIKALQLDLAEDATVCQRFLAEARVLARLQHPNIVVVFDVGDPIERPYFAMELIEGRTLADVLSGGNRLTVEQTVRTVANIASALDALHAAGLVHRDVKAANVMIARNGRVVLMDLGIARAVEGTRFTTQSLIIGTPETISPEQIRGGEVTPAADIYALGVLTYQMLAGRPPFLGDTAYLLYAHAHEPPAPLWELRPGLPGRLYAAVEESLSKDPAKRPLPASHLAAALAEAAGLAPLPPHSIPVLLDPAPPFGPEVTAPLPPVQLPAVEQRRPSQETAPPVRAARGPAVQTPRPREAAPAAALHQPAAPGNPWAIPPPAPKPHAGSRRRIQTPTPRLWGAVVAWIAGIVLIIALAVGGQFDDSPWPVLWLFPACAVATALLAKEDARFVTAAGSVAMLVLFGVFVVAATAATRLTREDWVILSIALLPIAGAVLSTRLPWRAAITPSLA